MCLFPNPNASILSRYGSIFYFSAQVMVGIVRPAIVVFLSTSRTRFADERGVSSVVQTNTPVWSRTEKANAKWCLPIGKSLLLRDNSHFWRALLPCLCALLSFAVHRQSLPICKPYLLRIISLARTITKASCTRKAWNALQRWRICFIRNFRIMLI